MNPMTKAQRAQGEPLTCWPSELSSGFSTRPGKRRTRPTHTAAASGQGGFPFRTRLGHPPHLWFARRRLHALMGVGRCADAPITGLYRYILEYIRRKQVVCEGPWHHSCCSVYDVVHWNIQRTRRGAYRVVADRRLDCPRLFRPSTAPRQSQRQYTSRSHRPPFPSPCVLPHLLAPRHL